MSHHGSIVLQHDIFQYTIDGQPDIIKMIREAEQEHCLNGSMHTWMTDSSVVGISVVSASSIVTVGSWGTNL